VDVRSSSPSHLPPGSITIPIFRKNSRPYATVLFGQGLSEAIGATAMFDTGSAWNIDCPTACARRWGIESDDADGLKARMIGGERTVRTARNTWVAIGDIRIGPTDARVMDIDGVDGFLVGAEFLSQFTVTIDYPRSRIVLSPATTANPSH
jgi:hypothetical protein